MSSVTEKRRGWTPPGVSALGLRGLSPQSLRPQSGGPRTQTWLMDDAWAFRSEHVQGVKIIAR